MKSYAVVLRWEDTVVVHGLGDCYTGALTSGQRVLLMMRRIGRVLRVLAIILACIFSVLFALLSAWRYMPQPRLPALGQANSAQSWDGNGPSLTLPTETAAAAGVLIRSELQPLTGANSLDEIEVWKRTEQMDGKSRSVYTIYAFLPDQAGGRKRMVVDVFSPYYEEFLSISFFPIIWKGSTTRKLGVMTRVPMESDHVSGILFDTKIYEVNPREKRGYTPILSEFEGKFSGCDCNYMSTRTHGAARFTSPEDVTAALQEMKYRGTHA